MSRPFLRQMIHARTHIASADPAARSSCHWAYLRPYVFSMARASDMGARFPS